MSKDGPRTDAPRTNREAGELDRKRALLHEPRMDPLRKYVARLRSEHGADRIPDFDPTEAGVDASILLLFEAPGPRATQQRGGSGFVSCDNDDTSAENMWRLFDELGLDRRREIVSWNVVPWYVGSHTRVRPVQDDDLEASRSSIAALCRLLPRVKVVVLLGRKAQQGWRVVDVDLPTVSAPHPSPQNLNTRPHLRPVLREALQEARRIAGGDVEPSGTHASDSTPQRTAEHVIRDRLGERLGIRLQSRRISLSGTTAVQVDGVSDDEQVLVEIFARQGPLKGGQVRKVALDALKLTSLGHARPDARLILAFASSEAAAYVQNPNAWLTEALRIGGIEVVTVDLAEALRAQLRAAQRRQYMGNVPSPGSGTLR